MTVADYEQLTREEVAEWPGVTVTFRQRAKHREATLTFGEQSQFAIYPSTPGDGSRGALNHIAEVRKLLRLIGAVRNDRPKSDAPKRERNPGALLRDGPEGEPGPIMPDPWAPLRRGLVHHADLIQGSEEWHAARCGLLTASEMKLIITPTLKIAANAKEKAHLWELAAQRISRYVEPTYIGDEMLRGHDDEILARELYSQHFAPALECGFFTNDKWGFTLGCSPDGTVGDEGLIEAKSRRQKFQIQAIVEHYESAAIPDDFTLQVQAELLVTERKWCDLISYSGGLPMLVMRVYPDARVQDAIVDAAAKFEARLNEAVSDYHAWLKSEPKLIPTERTVEQEMFV